MRAAAKKRRIFNNGDCPLPWEETNSLYHSPPVCTCVLRSTRYVLLEGECDWVRAACVTRGCGYLRTAALCLYMSLNHLDKKLLYKYPLHFGTELPLLLNINYTWDKKLLYKRPFIFSDDKSGTASFIQAVSRWIRHWSDQCQQANQDSPVVQHLRTEQTQATFGAGLM